MVGFCCYPRDLEEAFAQLHCVSSTFSRRFAAARDRERRANPRHLHFAALNTAQQIVSSLLFHK